MTFWKDNRLWISLLIISLILTRCASCMKTNEYEFQRLDYIKHIDYQDSLYHTHIDSLSRIITTQRDSLQVLTRELEKSRIETQYARDYNNNLKNSNNNLFRIIKKQNEIIQ